ncbi:MAG: acetyl-CoA hydrolase/transferase family protein [Gammaproteobacteria bacterium]|nr:acetyl-CoA hydrolase/transferase family protein [Gammaproteobacteria bacterium]
MTRWINAGEVASLLKPGMTVFIAGATAEPRTILSALRRQANACTGIHFVSVAIPGVNAGNFALFGAQTSATVFFATAENRDSIASGQIDFLPMQYRALYDYLANEASIDAVIVQLPPECSNGVHSQGISSDFLSAALSKATLVIAEINSQQPSPADAPELPSSRLDYAVHSDCPLPTLPIAEITPEAAVIGNHVAELVNNGDCIQIGIGAIPNATLAALGDKNDLGIHSGMISNGVQDLALAGNITGACKQLDKGKIVTGTALGNETLINWAGETPAVSFRPVSYTHDSCVTSKLDNFISINSALEVDLFGQINADVLQGCQVSGTGGSVDMMRAAACSRGGRSIVAFNATAAGGSVSRIVAALAPGTATTVLRTDIDYVVTEYGARRIRFLPLMARAEALIEIAAPQFRDQLRDHWRGID